MAADRPRSCCSRPVPSSVRSSCSAKRIRSVDVRRVDERCDLVDLLSRTPEPGRVGRAIEARSSRRPVENGSNSGSPSGTSMSKGSDGSASGVSVDVVVEELPPLPEVVRGASVVHHRRRLVAEDVAHEAGAGSIGTGGHITDAIAVRQRYEPKERNVAAAPQRIDRVVPHAVDGPVFARELGGPGALGMTRQRRRPRAIACARVRRAAALHGRDVTVVSPASATLDASTGAK